MLDIGSSELLLIVVVAILVIGPKDLPRVLYTIGQYVGKARAMTRHFRSGIDEMMRQAELAELEKKWAAENARIMAQHPPAPPAEDPAGDNATADAAQAESADAPAAAPPARPVVGETSTQPPGGREQA